MIRCSKHRTILKGSPAQVLEDYINISISVRRTLENTMSGEMARKCMVSCLKVAFSDDDDDEAREKYSAELADRFIEGTAERTKMK